MIKQIQLRGISRSPSDRMSQDGGLDESLNLYIDSAENAPALMPEDVTASLGLPDDLQADRIFVHKTANYENIIAVGKNEVGISVITGWIGGEKQDIKSLEQGEEVTDISSMGNTVILNTSTRPIYLLHKDGVYSFIGDAIPMPTIEFFDKETPVVDPSEGNFVISYPESLRGGQAQVMKYAVYAAEGDGSISDGAVIEFIPDYWDRRDAEGNHEVEGAKKVLADMKALYDEMKAANAEKGILNSSVWAVYGVRLYDGSVKVSMPYLLSGGIETPVDILAVSPAIGGAFYFLRINHYYQIAMRLYDYDESVISRWKDIIKGIDVYVSEDINALDWKTLSVDKREEIEGDTFAKFKVSGLKGEYFQDAMSRTAFAKVAEFAIDEAFYAPGCASVDEIRQDYVIDLKGRILNEDRINNGTLLSDEDYTFDWGTYRGKAQTLNNRLLLTDINKVMPYGPTWLLSQRFNSYLPIPRIQNVLGGIYPSWWEWTLPDETEIPKSHYYLTYHIGNENGDNAVVYGRTNDADTRFALNYGRYSPINPLAFTLFMYPDRDCKRIDVRDPGGFVISMDMQPHPFLPNCSYFYANTELYGALEVGEEKERPQEKNSISIPNKLGLSRMDNPLFFDETHFYTFQSRVLGVAIATTALSQGQFGQFPLYVFTEDGVWAMETVADGSFVTSKPLSRDVCINPDSITSIDNAVIFVTAKGVMLLQGSQVVNISPYMNGRHYAINESSRERIGRTEFADLIPVLEDSTPFMGFMKDASVAYDYQGKRLVFIKKDEDYQYVYKLDTQTWHKTAYGTDLLAPINSYPECYVQGKRRGTTMKVLFYASVYIQYDGTYVTDVTNSLKRILPDLTEAEVEAYLDGDGYIDVTGLDDDDYEFVYVELDEVWQTGPQLQEITLESSSRIYDLSTVLDGTREQETARGCIITRPMDFGYADVRKVIRDIRIRGQYAKGAVRFMLLGSDDGETYHVLNSLRGRSWKLFRIIILADLDRHERISWIDIDFETRFTNRLR